MKDVLRDGTPEALTIAMEANLVDALFALLRGYPGASIVETPHALSVMTGVPHAMMNAVMRPKFACGDAADARIEETLEPFIRAGVPVLWWLGPSAQPADLLERLQTFGIGPLSNMPGMAIDLDTVETDRPMPPGLEIFEVVDPETLRQYLVPFADGFDLPRKAISAIKKAMLGEGLASCAPGRAFVGLHEGLPVCCAASHLSAGVNGIYNVATTKAARHHGYGLAVILKALERGRRHGYRYGVLQSSALAEGLYRKIGFREVCRVRMCAWFMARHGPVI